MSVALTRRRRPRRDATDAEASLWAQLRGRRLAGFKFRRQHPCGPFILDFFCAARRLAIELDGGHRFEPRIERYDTRRARFLAGRGIEVLRFSNLQVLREREAVLLAILFALDGHFPLAAETD
ncbi:MAG TPA: endonuclease domain-containing protein [Polyangia bacterium]|nr:endonuclease domain-containing protein [Polyangia bacterium]